MADYLLWTGVAPGSSYDVFTLSGALNGHLKSATIKSNEAVPGTTAITTSASGMTVASDKASATATLYTNSSTAIPFSSTSVSSKVITITAQPTFNGASGVDSLGTAVSKTIEYRKSVEALSGLSAKTLWMGQTPSSVTITGTANGGSFYANTVNFTKTAGSTDSGITLNGTSASLSSASSSTVTMNFNASTAKGTSTFKAQVANGYPASVSAIFTVENPSLSNATVAVGGTCTVSLANPGNTTAASWSSSDTSKATCTNSASNSTTVTGKVAGSITLTATSGLNGCTAAATRTCTITIVAAATITFHKDSSTSTAITTANIGDTIYWKVNGDTTNVGTPSFTGCSKVSGGSTTGVITISAASFSVSVAVNGATVTGSGTATNMSLSLG